MWMGHNLGGFPVLFLISFSHTQSMLLKIFFCFVCVCNLNIWTFQSDTEPEKVIEVFRKLLCLGNTWFAGNMNNL